MSANMFTTLPPLSANPDQAVAAFPKKYVPMQDSGAQPDFPFAFQSQRRVYLRHRRSAMNLSGPWRDKILDQGNWERPMDSISGTISMFAAVLTYVACFSAIAYFLLV
jgi:hypothetical protein